MYVKDVNDVVLDRNQSFQRIFEGKRPEQKKMFFRLDKYTPTGYQLKVPATRQNLIKYNWKVMKNLDALELQKQKRKRVQDQLVKLKNKRALVNPVTRSNTLANYPVRQASEMNMVHPSDVLSEKDAQDKKFTIAMNSSFKFERGSTVLMANTKGESENP